MSLRTMLCAACLGLFLPLNGFTAGQIFVYASDTSKTGTPPPSAVVRLNHGVPQSFGTNNGILLTNVTAGIHTVEVTVANGYLPVESLIVENSLDDPDSEYGNPRRITVTDNETVSENFRFDPVVYVKAVIRDAWTMERLEGAEAELIINSGPSSDFVFRNYPWTASYAPNWRSAADGQLPSNTCAYATEICDLRITLTNYQAFISNNVINDASAGDVVDVQDIFLTPIDSNANSIADSWELLNFNSNVNAMADSDGDGSCNLNEYLSGTDPDSDLSLFSVNITAGTNLTLSWNTAACRTYRVVGTTTPETGAWVQVAGPWEATNGQTEMSWVETNVNLSWHNYYRVEIVPCDWQGTNQVLICTNAPATGGSGGGTNGLPPLP